MLDSLSAALRPELAAARDTDPEGEQGNAGGNRQSLDRMTRTLHHRFSQPETHAQWWSSPLRRPPGIVGQESSPCERSIPMGACIGCRVRVRSSMSLSASGGCCAAGPRPIACSLTWPLYGRPYGTTSVTTSPCARKCSRSWKVHGRRKKKQSEPLHESGEGSRADLEGDASAAVPDLPAIPVLGE
jgi:hypothetical protein